MHFPIAFESQAPTVDGPVYTRLTQGGTRLAIGSEFTLTAGNIDVWVRLLTDARAHMKSESTNVVKLRA